MMIVYLHIKFNQMSNSTTVTVRIDKQDKATVKRAADKSKRKVSEYIRLVSIEAAKALKTI